MLSRRELIGKAAAGAAAAAAVGAAGTAVASVRRRPNAPGIATAEHDEAKTALPTTEEVSAPPPWALLQPLGAGAVVAHGWKLTDLSAVVSGSSVVTLQNPRGRTQRIRLCRNDGTPQGLVYTRRVDLVVMNEGYGELPTEEGLAQAVAALAHAVAANEATAAGGVVAELLSHAERVRRFAAAPGEPTDGRLR